MHYCFLTSGSWEANASFVRLREFGNQLLARGHQVSIIADDFPYNHEKLPGVFNNQASIQITRPSRGLGQILARRKLVRQINPDYVHVLNPFIKAYMALRFSGAKIIGDWDEWPAHRNFKLPRLMLEKFLDRWLRRQSHRVVVASKYLQRQFEERYNLDAAYIPYATYLTPQPDGESPFTEPTAVYVGNFYPAYDHDLLFEAARMLRDKGFKPRITFLGTGPDLEKWRQFAAEQGLDNLTIPGFLSGDLLWRHLRHAHILLFPIRETLLNVCRCPSKTFAYAQARRPIVTNRVGEVPEVLEQKGTYIDCTAHGFANLLQDVMQQPRPEDVDYNIESKNWSARTDDLLAAINGRATATP
jgi:glycosyltransferase involved in cell wall biosynthesis